MSLNRQCQKLEQMFELARIARGWNRTQLAQALGRDPSRMVPPSGNPKLDVVVKLARVLEWPVGDVVEALYDGDSDDLDLIIGQQVDTTIEDRMAGLDGDGLYELALELRSTGRNHDVIAVARRMREVGSVQNIGEGWSFEAVSWNFLGRFVQCMEAASHGLAVTGLPVWLRQNLTFNLAEALYALWRLPLSLALCDRLLRDIPDPGESGSRADLHHVILTTVLRGKVLRVLGPQANDSTMLETARADFERAVLMCDEHQGISGTQLHARLLESEVGLQSVLVDLGSLGVEDFIDDLMKRLDRHLDLDAIDVALAEAVGWACVFGCEVANRHLVGERKSRVLGVLSNKVVEVAEAIDHWLLRERALSLQFSTCESGTSPTLAIDDADRATIVATMGRFPHFRSVAWSLLEPRDEGWA